MENNGKLRKREYTLPLKDNMSNISKMQWWMPPVLYPPRVIPYGIHGMEGGG